MEEVQVGMAGHIFALAAYSKMIGVRPWYSGPCYSTRTDTFGEEGSYQNVGLSSDYDMAGAGHLKL